MPSVSGPWILINTDKVQRLNGLVSGTVNGESFSNANLHSFIYIKDARTYTAVSPLSPSISYSLQSISPVAEIMGWLFALPSGKGLNGFSLTGGCELILNPSRSFGVGVGVGRVDRGMALAMLKVKCLNGFTHVCGRSRGTMGKTVTGTVAFPCIPLRSLACQLKQDKSVSHR